MIISISAEKVSSLGKYWHRGCLKCKKCSKTLAAGNHAEVSTNLYIERERERERERDYVLLLQLSSIVYNAFYYKIFTCNLLH